MRSTNICQKPFILSCLLFRLLFSLSVFFLCLLSLSLSLSSFSVSLCLFLSVPVCLCLRVLVVCVVVCVCVVLCGVVWCGVVCAVWCGTLKNPVCRFKTPRCVHSKTSPWMPATRAHAFQHVRVVPVHTGDLLNGHTGALWIYTRFFFGWTHGVHGEGVGVSLANFTKKNSGFDHVHEHLKRMLGSSLTANFCLP